MAESGRITAVIVAAGRGTRAGAGVPKQWRTLGQRTVLAHTLDAMRHAPVVDDVVLVLHRDDLDLAAGYLGHADVRVATGGDTRAASARAGLEALADDPPSLVLIHDVARPCVPVRVIDDVVAALQTNRAAAPALPVTDALWSGAEGYVTGTRDRAGLFRAQTPQGFHFDAILSAHRAHGGDAPDDVSIARAAGLEVAIVPGDEDNLKITDAADFARAEAILERGMAKIPDIRLGNGFDVHAFKDGDAVILCGVRVPHDRALKGHSDADVGLHAITDAIYGAMAEGDIGRHFPPSDPQWKGADSAVFLHHARDLAAARGFAISNVDLTMICEQPKIGPHADDMMTEVATLLNIDRGRVSVKATTSERLGFTGRAEGIAALATATLVAT